MRFVVVGNPENRRVSFFEDAARSQGHDCRVLAWMDVLADGLPDDLRGDSILRIESPGENWAVERALIRRGRSLRGADPDAWDSTEDRGRIRAIGDAFAGFRDVLESFPSTIHYLNNPAAVCAMFDKVETRRRLAKRALPVPASFGMLRTFDALVQALRSAGASRAFVKPRHGSSASGVIALSMLGDRVVATTSIELAGDRLYNSLRVRRYNRLDDVRTIVDLLGAEDELVVEEWIPKASAQGGTFDLRLVCIDGECGHRVMRLSRSPMTNLHLGNARGDLAALRATMGGAVWEKTERLALDAAAAFDDALYAGVDLGVTPGFGHLVVFEVNAFGDLLPGVRDPEGRTTYEAQIAAW